MGEYDLQQKPWSAVAGIYIIAAKLFDGNVQ